MIPMLAPLFQGQWASYGETLECCTSPPDGALVVADLLKTDVLHAALQRHAQHLQVCTQDWRPVASAWSLTYLWRLLPPAVAAISVLQQGFPLAASQMHVMLDDDGEAARFYICDEGLPLRGTSTATRYRPLLEQHLAPLFDNLHHLTGLAPKILWGNAARYLEPILEQALLLSKQSPAIVADHDWLLQQRVRPENIPITNPLYGRQRIAVHDESGQTSHVKLHRQCCLYHLLPGEDYCGLCPLSPGNLQISERNSIKNGRMRDRPAD